MGEGYQIRESEPPTPNAFLHICHVNGKSDIMTNGSGSALSALLSSSVFLAPDLEIIILAAAFNLLELRKQDELALQIATYTYQLSNTKTPLP